MCDDVKDYLHEIMLIKNGVNMWDNRNLPAALHAYKRRYLLTMAQMPTTTQMIERQVKLANHCTIGSRSESTRSIYAIVNHETVKNCREKRKKGDEELDDIERGKKRGKKMIEYTANEYMKRKSNTVNERKLKKNKIVKSSEQYRTKRIDDTIKLYKDNFDKEVPVHRFEKRTGVDHTYLIKNEVPFSEMTKVAGFRPAIMDEIAARGITMTPEQMKNFNVVKRILKDHEGNEKSFRPKLDYKRFQWW